MLSTISGYHSEPKQQLSGVHVVSDLFAYKIRDLVRVQLLNIQVRFQDPCLTSFDHLQS